MKNRFEVDVNMEYILKNIQVNSQWYDADIQPMQQRFAE